MGMGIGETADRVSPEEMAEVEEKQYAEIIP